MIVVDASVIVDVVLDQPPVSGTVQRRLARESAPPAAPHLIDAEVAHVLRRSVLRGLVPSTTAAAALDDLAALGIERHPHGRLLRRAFALRDNASIYDALYLALAEALEATLVTRDAALAKVPGIAAKVDVLA